MCILRPGDSAYIVAGRVHASFNLSLETAHLKLSLLLRLGMGSGYELEDVSEQQPWASLRSPGSGAPAGGN